LNTYQQLSGLQRALRAGDLCCVDVIRAFLKRIHERPEINAFLEVYADEALERAAWLDAAHAAGQWYPLSGMVVALKDNIAYKGHRFSASSKILEGFESLFSATATQRLFDAGAIFIGRVNCDEFAMGSSNENSAFGPVLNPLDPQRVPGGSSGGSAAAVAAGFCHAALGSDTGGSIRQPAAYCGVVGLKPTYGRISRHGLIAFGSSFDQIGPITHSLEDAALLTEIMAGVDEYDGTCSRRPPSECGMSVQSGANAPLKLVVLEDLEDSGGLDPEMFEAYQKLLVRLKEEGHQIITRSLPELKYSIPTYYILATAEASSNLSRYSGVHFGYRNPEATTLEETYKKSRTQGFGKEVRRRIMLGTFVLSEAYYDAYYSKGQKVRRLLRDKSIELLQDADALLLPTTTGAAFRFGEKSDDPIQMYKEDMFTVLANLNGFPAVSIPFAMNSEQLPLGIQLMGRPWEEGRLLSAASQLKPIQVVSTPLGA
jgi:aspartyl-tRNA(Asn)/glutamyl-tRNA(Gln) amidotransferase subunit A